jgi:hypothetical protein
MQKKMFLVGGILALVIFVSLMLETINQSMSNLNLKEIFRLVGWLFLGVFCFYYYKMLSNL